MDPPDRPMTLPEDRALLDAFRHGQHEALVQVYQHYAPIVAGVLKAGFMFESQGRRCRFRGLSSAFDVEDRLQEVFARAFVERARLAYDGLAPYQAYIVRIARNLVIDDFRSKKQALIEYFEELPEALSEGLSVASEPLHGLLDTSGDPEVDATARETLTLVEAFITTLAPRERRVLELRFRQGLDQHEIVAQTGLSPSRVKTSELRIRRQFFGFMKRNGYFAGYRLDQRGWLRALTRAREVQNDECAQ